ncbi:HNH endonuclease [Tsukamurella tyrosinosolvens]|uniref:HNH endonuclease n=1 Tax=Tsukamurella tyrosinosolvens TaxID=57704 RepID=UPI000DF6CEAF|nr:HNH endonuclease [Tsukamurella tyrosinosolvens]RDB47065.1 HNH endonuclease [Tsukamurella tyrosinosolvens]
MIDDSSQLPHPDSAELEELVSAAELRRIYRVLYERRDDPPTMTEIDDYLREVTGVGHSQRGRRVRELYPVFDIRKTSGRYPRYVLRGLNLSPAINAKQVSARVRYEVLSVGRCAVCGRTVADDGIRLEVDHVLPQAWGGDSEPDNLQALCVECNAGKKASIQSYEPFEAIIRRAVGFESPHRRAIELLLYTSADSPLPSSVFRTVLNFGTQQDEWDRRMRELRDIGWDYATPVRYEGRRRTTMRYLTRSSDIPDDIAAAVRAAKPKRRR